MYVGVVGSILAVLPMLLTAEDAVLYCMVTMAGVACPQLYITYQGFLLQTFFIPIMGRVGSEDRPDVIIGVMTMLPVAMVITLQVWGNFQSVLVTFCGEGADNVTIVQVINVLVVKELCGLY